MEELAKKNGFIGCFKTSAKDGKNINEALNYLICDIINKMEKMKLNKEKNANLEEERKSRVLESNIKDKVGNKSYNKMEESNEDAKKCSFKKHKDKEATNYCYNCKVYLCNKCADYHKGLLKNHQIVELDEISDETFTGLCKEENHNLKLEYYCKNHNILCCGLCISKIKGNGNGQHNECDICLIKDIKEEKKSKLKDNIKALKNF